MPTYLYL